MIEGMDDLLKNLSDYPKKVVGALAQAAEISQALVVADARQNHPYTDRTENLTNSIQAGRILITELSVEAEVVALMDYASFVEMGTSRARAFPFLYPAVMAQQADYVKRVAAAVRGLEK